MKRNRCIALLFVVVLALLLAASSILQKRATVEAAGVQAPRFEVDPMWPKPLPNYWVIGSVIGVAVDANDHIWIIHRQGSLEPKEMSAASKPPGAECCSPAPTVLEFNEAGDSGIGAARAKATTGRRRTMESRSTTKAMSGSAETDEASSLPRSPPMKARW